MSPTIELADQLFETGPVTQTSSCVEWAYHSEDWCLRIEAHSPGVFRLRCGPKAWLNPAKPSARAQRHAAMLLAREEAVGELDCVAVQPGVWRINQGEASLVLEGAGPSVQILSQDACIARASLTLPVGAPADTTRLWQVNWQLQDTEGIFGLGETCHDLDRRGARLVSDAPASRCLPLAWSPLGWGVYPNTLNQVVHTLDTPEQYQLQVQGAGLDIFLFVGDPSEILNQYTALTGRAGQPDLWPMGVWMDQADGQTPEASLQQVRSMRAQGLALDAVRLAEPAIIGFQADKPVFEWSDRVPDWRVLVAEAETLNVHLAGSLIPGVIQGTTLFDEWEDRGWLLCDDSGSAWVCPGTAASGGQPFGLLDLTHKDAARLWTERYAQALEDNLQAPVCQAQFDFPDDVEARGGESGAILRTAYPHLARQALFDAVAGPRTPQEGVMLSRDLFPGVQRFAWQQGPQVDNTWGGFAQTLRAALAVGNSGVAVQTHTLGCAGRPAAGLNAELYLRWLAMCVFSANFSFQGRPDLMPDAFDADTRALVQHWLQWRYRLLPYIAGIIDDAVRTGLPVQRSMMQAYPADPEAHAWDTQYLLGPALLVAPVMQPGQATEIYLPQGDAWWDLSTGWRYEGGTRLALQAGLDALPVFGREGHMLCLGPVTQHTGEINSARILEEVWMFGMPEHNPVVMRNKIRVMQMQGSSYIKGLEGLRILPSEGLEVKRRGAEVRISRAR